MSWITLYGGECDGYRQKATFSAFAERPDIFYVPSLLDLDRIKAIKDQIAKAEEFKRCSRLAYEFHSTGINSDEITYKFRRCTCEHSHDKTVEPARKPEAPL